MVRPAEKQYDPASLEKRVRDRWTTADAYRATRRARESGKPWYFIDGPPYATGHIHLGTARNKVLKDAMVRHMSMRGHAVRDQAGFDMHGLPIEVKVEKELGFGSKRDIEEYGVEKFVTKCRDFAMSHMRIMTEEFRELGVWLDFDKPYLTLDNSYIEGAWWALAKAHERGLLFESERVLAWCWRCEAPLANAEVEFEDRTDPSVYVKFPLKDRPGEFLVIWTTTPWTLPANVAVAANPQLAYARVRGVRKDGREEIVHVVAEQVESVAQRAGYVRHEVLSTATGADLEGLRYEHPFALEVGHHREPRSDWNNRVLLGTHVLGDRTGLVHTATGHGVEDFAVGQKYGVAVFSPVGEDGRYTDAAGAFKGLRVKGARTPDEDADARVLDSLRAKGLLLAKGEEKHSYGHCWRCKNPIVFRATKQWFIDVAKIQEQMIQEVERVRWTPEWAGSARQMEWVRNARDWCISRQRYWGIPLPVWSCGACGRVHVVDSVNDLKHLSPDYKDGMDLHRPWIDRVTLACQCGGRMKRVPDVLDVWFDSAVAAWAELEYPRNKGAFEQWFPCDWICEGLDQTRGWFYSQLGAGVASMGRVPYESVLMHGWVHDERGRPMSKSLGNIVAPHDVIEKVGVDAMRFHIVSAAAPWDDLSFSVETAKNASRTFNILWNVHVFATQYMALDAFDPRRVPLASVKDAMAPEDRWMQSRLQTLIEAVTRSFHDGEMHKGAREIERFVLDDLSRWYVRLVRDRAWDEAGSDRAKLASYRTLHDALLTTSKLLAPYAPFVADAIHADLVGAAPRRGADEAEASSSDAGPATVHMTDWPVADPTLKLPALEREMAVARDLVEAAANARQKANMKLRWPVRKVVVAGPHETGEAVERLRPVLLAQTNAKAIEFVGTTWRGLLLAAEPVKNLIGPAFKQDSGKVMQAIREADGRHLKDAFDRDGRATVGPYEVTPDMVRFEAKLPDHVIGASFSGGSLYIDTEVDDAIRGEGYSRDLVRRVQEMRKELKLDVNETITVEVAAGAEMERLVAPHLPALAGDVRATRLVASPAPKGDHVRDWDLEGDTLRIAITRAGGTAAAPPTRAATVPKRKRKPKPKAKPSPKGKPKRASKPAPKRTTKAKAKAIRRPTAARKTKSKPRARARPKPPGKPPKRVRGARKARKARRR